MKSLNRVHLYPHSEPNGIAYVVADKQGLRDLAKKLMQAADGATGIETLTVHGSDGHAYEMYIVADMTESEWQNMPVPAQDLGSPAQLEIVQVYNSLRQDLVQKNQLM